MRHITRDAMLATVLLASMVLGACQPAATEVPAAPTEAMEEPTEVIKEPTEAMEEPTEVIEEPTEAVEEPTEAVEEPCEMIEEPMLDFSNEPYVPDGHWRQVLDVYLPPEGEGPYPTILAFHGGGFIARSKDLYAPYARHFTDQGYALVPANYRYAPADTYPAQVEDAFCAFAWIHANASEFGFDTDQIFVMGDSAGGYLAAMLGTVETPDTYQGECPYEMQQSNSPLGVVVLYGFFDLTNMDGFDPELS